MTDDHLDEQGTGGRDQGARHTERVYRPSRQDSCITPVERPSAVGNGALLPRCYALPAEPNSTPRSIAGITSQLWLDLGRRLFFKPFGSCPEHIELTLFPENRLARQNHRTDEHRVGKESVSRC